MLLEESALTSSRERLVQGVERFRQEQRERYEAGGGGPGTTRDVASGLHSRGAARRNTLLQVDNALSHPLLRQKVEAGEVELHAWFYDVGRAELFEWDAPSGTTSTLPIEPTFVGGSREWSHPCHPECLSWH
jgi:hypothetical protein